MAQKNVIETLLRFKSDISQITQSTAEIQKQFSNLKPTAAFEKSFLNTLSKLQNEIGNFESKAARGVASMADSKALEASGRKVIELYDQIKNQVKVLGKLSDDEMSKLFPEMISDNLKKATEALKKYQSFQEKNQKTLEKETKELEDQKKVLSDIEKERKRLSKIKPLSDVEYGARKKQRDAAKSDSEKKIVAQLAAEQKIRDAIAKGAKVTKSGELDRRNPANAQLIDELKELTKQAEEARIRYEKLRGALDQEVSESTLSKDLEKVNKEAQKAQDNLTKAEKAVKDLETAGDKEFTGFIKNIEALTGLDLSKLDNSEQSIKAIDRALEGLTSEELIKIKNIIGLLDDDAQKAIPALTHMRDSIEGVGKEARELTETERELENFKNNILQFFSIGNAVQLFKRAVTSAINTIKELDAVMTEIAVVSDFDISDMWEKLPEFTNQANRLGAAVKDAYAATTLYIQQGLNMNDSMELSNETLKMARIANLNAADATDAMTSALRGFNMELDKTSAEKVNDVYSKLAAITASDVNEISTAMTKTASIASSANMEFETTAAFLSQIIETTRESAETAGTALKTVIARFQELKKDPSTIGEVDGEVVDANKIETALRTIGVSLRDTSGQFRDLDDVFIEIASKWDSLDTNTQRYIATMAAGSRQQSRFIAMMSDYERTMELVSAANNSAGASQEQFNKTLDSLESKLNRMRNAWDEFTMGIANNQLVKFGVDALTTLLETVNKLSSGAGDLGEAVIKLGLSFGAIKGGGILFKNLFAKLSGKEISHKMGGEMGNSLIKGFKKKIEGTKLYSKQSGTNLFKSFFTNTSELQKAMMNTSPLSQMLNNLDPKDIDVNKLRGKLDEVFKTLPEGDQNAIQLLMPNFDDSIEGVQKYAKEIEEAGGDTSKIVGQMQGAGQQMSKDWVMVGAAVTGVGVAISGIGSLLQKSENEKWRKFGEVLSSVGTALTVCGTILSVGIPLASKIAGHAIKSIPFVGWAIAAVTALTAVIKVFDVLHENAEEKMERLNKEMEAASEVAKETKEAYEELLSAFDNYDEAQNALNELTTGTEEWKRALIDANNQVLELLKTYPELANYVTRGEDGRLIISEEGQNFIVDKQRQAMLSGAAMQAGAQIALSKEEFIQDKALIEQRKNNLVEEQAFKTVNEGNFFQRLWGYYALSQEKQTAGYTAAYTDIDYKDALYSSGLHQQAKQELVESGELNKIEHTYTQKILEFEENFANQVSSALQTTLEASTTEEMLGSGYAGLLQNFFSETANPEKLLTQVDALAESYKNEYKDSKELAQAYLDATGLDKLPENLVSDESIRRALASVEVFGDISTKMNDAYLYIAGKNEKDQKKILSLLKKDGAGLTKAQAELYKSMIPTDQNGNLQFGSIEQMNALHSQFGEVASALGMRLDDFLTMILEQSNMAIETFDKSVEQLSRNSISAKWLTGLEIDSGSLKMLSDNLYNIFLDSGAASAQEILNSIQKGAKDMDETTRQMFIGVINGIDWNDVNSIKELSDKLTELGFVFDETVFDVNDFENSLIEASRALRNITFDEVKDDLKSLEDIAEDLESGESDKIYTTDEANKLIKAGANKEDFVMSGIDQWTYVGETNVLLAAIKGHTGDILTAVLSEAQDRVEKTKTALDAEFGISKADELKRLFGVLESDLAKGGDSAKILMKNMAGNVFGDPSKASTIEFLFGLYQKGKYDAVAPHYANLDKIYGDPVDLLDYKPGLGFTGWYADWYNSENKTASEAELRGVAAALGLNRNKEGKENFNLYDLELADLTTLLTRFYEENILNYEKDQQALSVSGGGSEGVGLDKDSERQFEYMRNTPLDEVIKAASKDKAAQDALKALAQEAGLSEQAINDFGNSWKELGAAIKDERIIETLGKTAEDILDITKEYENLDKVLGEDVKKIGYLFGFTNMEENSTGFKFIKDNIEIIEQAMKGDRASWDALMKNDAFKNAVAKMLGLSISDANLSPYAFMYATGNMTGVADPREEEEKEVDLLDRQYNNLQDLNAEMRERERLEREYNKLLEDNKIDIAAIYALSMKEIESLKKQKALQEDILGNAETKTGRIGEAISIASSLKGYVTYDEENNKITVDHAALDTLAEKDSDKYEEIIDKLKELEDVSKEIDDIKNEISDIEDNVKKIKERGKEEYSSLEKRIFDALIERDNQLIEGQEKINDSIDNAASDLVGAIQTNINKLRQDRQNEETQKSISEKETRLAYLRQDTSGANTLEIKKLEEEIAKEKESYGDTLVDQALQDLQTQNDYAAEQRNKQIELMREQIEANKSNGYYAAEAVRILTETLQNGGIFSEDSEFYKLITGTEDWGAKSNIEQKEMLEELKGDVESAALYTGIMAGDNVDYMELMLGRYKANGGEVDWIIRYLNDLRNEKLKAKGDEWIKAWGMYSNEQNDSQYGYIGDRLAALASGANPMVDGSTWKPEYATGAKPSEEPLIDDNLLMDIADKPNFDYMRAMIDLYKRDGEITSEIWTYNFARNQKLYKNPGMAEKWGIFEGQQGVAELEAYLIERLKGLGRYKTGGLADFTGPAWLDGTKSRPEMVLNAQDTENFILLKDVLSSLLHLPASNTDAASTNYIDVSVQVDEISNDYDVDQMVDRVKQKIYEDGMYRNNNMINLIR